MCPAVEGGQEEGPGFWSFFVIFHTPRKSWLIVSIWWNFQKWKSPKSAIFDPFWKFRPFLRNPSTGFTKSQKRGSKTVMSTKFVMFFVSGLAAHVKNDPQKTCKNTFHRSGFEGVWSEIEGLTTSDDLRAAQKHV